VARQVDFEYFFSNFGIRRKRCFIDLFMAKGYHHFNYVLNFHSFLAFAAHTGSPSGMGWA